MPFGLHGAPVTFQRLMDRVPEGCENYSAAYLDDVVIFSNTWEEHVQHLSLVLVRSFLGLASSYRRFVLQFATIAAPLIALTCKDQRNLVTWTDM